ncbi:MAG: hypothetical protein AAF591_12595 [Verrucomicrobiota bacterium]
MAAGELTVEVVGRFDEGGACDELLYAPLAGDLRFRRTRWYCFDYEGERGAVEDFVRSTLVDGVSQEVRFGEGAALEGYRFHLDYGMKKGVLDLEKEAILGYYRELEGTGFELKGLQLATRIYVFGEAESGARKHFIRDIVNPAIHTYTIGDERSCA